MKAMYIKRIIVKWNVFVMKSSVLSNVLIDQEIMLGEMTTKTNKID